MPPIEDHYKIFSSEMDMLSRTYDVGRVFGDFLTMGVCAFHQINIASSLKEKDLKNEALYMKTIKCYSREDLDRFGKLLGIIQAYVYSNPYGDLLGRYFTEHISNGRNGQFFTPDPVCEMMAILTGANAEMTGEKVLDPTCGSGRLLLQFAKVAPDNYFYGADLSNTCAKMSALN